MPKPESDHLPGHTSRELAANCPHWRGGRCALAGKLKVNCAYLDGTGDPLFGKSGGPCETCMETMRKKAAFAHVGPHSCSACTVFHVPASCAYFVEHLLPKGTDRAKADHAARTASDLALVKLKKAE